MLNAKGKWIKSIPLKKATLKAEDRNNIGSFNAKKKGYRILHLNTINGDFFAISIAKNRKKKMKFRPTLLGSPELSKHH